MKSISRRGGRKEENVGCCRVLCHCFVFIIMGELARKPGCPEVAETPLDLLTPRPGEGYTFLDRMVTPILGAASGVGMVVLANMFRKRPVWAGIQVHILCGGVGWFIASAIHKSKFASRAERDAVFRHYISLHPEDFPPFERKRFADVYYPFKPIR